MDRFIATEMFFKLQQQTFYFGNNFVKFQAFLNFYYS